MNKEKNDLQHCNCVQKYSELDASLILINAKMCPAWAEREPPVFSFL